MERDTRNFFLGATWFVVLISIVAIVIYGLIWGDRYMQFEHTHRTHEHPPHEHSYVVPEHEHPHIHVMQEAVSS